MINHQTHKQFGFEDIQRYLNGTMNPAEKHELERAALQDPFLSDAIEGFEEQGTASYTNHQQEIAAKLLPIREAAPIVSISKKMYWMRIAALIILIAGVGIFGYQNFKPGKTEVVAQQQEIGGKKDVLPESTLPEAEKKIAQTESSLPEATNKNNTNNKDFASLKLNEKQNTQLNFAPQEMEASADIKYENDADQSASKNNPDDNSDVTSNSNSKTKEMIGNADSISFFLQSNTIEAQLTGRVAGVQIDANRNAKPKISGNTNGLLQGIVTDETGKPLANVSVISADKKNVAITDMQGKFSIAAKDSSTDATVAAVGYTTAQVKLNMDAAQNQFVLAPAASALSEVVVTSLGIKRDRKALGYTTDKLENALQPIGGWESFHEYVRIKLGMDSLEYYSEVPGEEMTIEFTLDKEGNPSNVQILSYQGSEKGEMVRSIIETGPRWTKPDKKKKVRTTIPR